MRRTRITGLLMLATCALVACALTACQSAGEADHYSAAADSARYAKLDAAGRALALAAGPWACVLDRDTGLVWENKTDNETLHYAAASYSWFDDDTQVGAQDLGTCHLDREHLACDSADLVRAVRAKALCGRGDWRLPTLAELQGLQRAAAPGEPQIAGYLLPFTQRSPYWSADTRRTEVGDLEVGVYSFMDGQTRWLRPSQAVRLRLVAQMQGAPGNK